jgi:uncharacterized protein (TIGR03067 family)
VVDSGVKEDVTMFIRSIAMALVAVGVVGADRPKDVDEGKAVAVASQLEGKWGSNSYIEDGILTMTKGDVYGFVLVFQRDRFTGKCLKEQEGRYVDTRIGGIDMQPEKGEWAGKTLKGIFKVEGDTVTICLGHPGKDRPTRFECEIGSRCTLYVLKRI